MQDTQGEEDWRVSDFHTIVDIAYEHRMQDSEVWLDENHFLTQDWYKDSNNARIILSKDRPLLVHTWGERDEQGKSMAHDCHRMIALVHLLQTASVGSEVFISIPFLSDFHVIDQLGCFARPAKDGGRDLTIKVVLGPDDENRRCFERFIGNCEQRYSATQRLQVRQFGDHQGNTDQYAHTKAVISSSL